MNIGSIGKVLANQAIETTKKSVMEAVTGQETSAKQAEAPAPPARATASPNEDVGAIVIAQIQAMQRHLREDQELQVWVRTAQEALRVCEIFVPHSTVLVLSGMDHQGNLTRAIVPADKAELVCKVVPVLNGFTARRINVMTMRPKTEPAAAATNPATPPAAPRIS